TSATPNCRSRAATEALRIPRKCTRSPTVSHGRDGAGLRGGRAQKWNVRPPGVAVCAPCVRPTALFLPDDTAMSMVMATPTPMITQNHHCAYSGLLGAGVGAGAPGPGP